MSLKYKIGDRVYCPVRAKIEHDSEEQRVYAAVARADKNDPLYRFEIVGTKNVAVAGAFDYILLVPGGLEIGWLYRDLKSFDLVAMKTYNIAQSYRVGSARLIGCYESNVERWECKYCYGS